MKNNKGLVIFIGFAFLVLFLNGRTAVVEYTYEDVVHSFLQYEEAITAFSHIPVEEEVVTVLEAGFLFYDLHDRLNSNQTFYNQLFRRGTILSKEEKEQMNRFLDNYWLLDKQFLKVALEDVYMANDFEALLEEAKKLGSFALDNITITFTNNDYDIKIDGIFHSLEDDRHPLSRRVFFIQLGNELFYWKRPNQDYQMFYTDRLFSLKTSGETYSIKAKNISHDFDFSEEP